MHSYFRSKRKTKCTLQLNLPNGELALNHEEVANCLNYYFQSVVHQPSSVPPNSGNATGPTIRNILISQDDVFHTLKACNPTKVPETDNIHATLFHHYANSLAKPLQIICQKSMTEATVRNDWNDALNTYHPHLQIRRAKPPFQIDRSALHRK